MEKIITKVLALLGTVLLFTSVCTAKNSRDTSKVTSSADSSNQYWPESSWRKSTPEAQGVDSKELIDMYNEIQKNKIDIHSVLIIRNGYVVSEGYFNPQNKDTLNEVFSVTKSFNSTLVGIAINQGYIKNTKEKVMDIFHDLKINDVDERKRNLNIGHLLTMSAGHGQDTFGSIFSTTGNWVETYMNIPFVKDPGTEFLYDSGASNVLSYIIEKKTGQNLFDYAKKNLLEPIGIKRAYWGTNPDGKAGGFYGLQLSTSDMARLGYLYLNNGVWNGKQIVPKDWVEQSTKPLIKTAASAPAWQAGYGYNWWMNSFDGYRADGMGGQNVFVLPKYNAVVVFTSAVNGTGANHPVEFVKKFIIPSFKSNSPLPENNELNEQLNELCSNIEKEPTAEQKPIPEFAHTISGTKYKLDSNPNGIASVKLEFNKNDSNQANFILEQQGATYEFEVGLDGKFLFKQIEMLGSLYTNAYKGHWKSDNTFILEARSVGSLWTRIYRFEFNGKENLNLTINFPYTDLTSQRDSYSISGKAE